MNWGVERSGLRCEACNNFFPPQVRLTGPAADLPAALEYAEAGQTSLVLLMFSFLILAVVYAVNRKVWAVWPKNC